LAPEPFAGNAWAALAGELNLWAETDAAATLWWRDDDAAAATPELDRLLALSAGTGAPLALAVIPGRLTPDLPPRLAGCHGIAVLQHGWRHINHAGVGEGAWELGDHRPLSRVQDELNAGHRRLAEAFGARFLPVVVPPWNRISARVTQALPALGFIGVSTFGARVCAEPAPGLIQVNVHCDPVRWKERGRFAGTARTLDDLTGHLAARRKGIVDPREPTGLVSHHLALDPRAWDFVAEVLRRTKAHPAARWLSAPEAFGR
jgi:peptidoglycan/xylan/chitin deacetylase (PgdA/CDA1 family)